MREVFDRKPTQADIISVFKGKTQWHLTYAKTFPKLSGYPEMVSWLEDSDEKLSDLELWGTVKSTYTFSDLSEWLAKRGVGLKKMGTQSLIWEKARIRQKRRRKAKGRKRKRKWTKAKGKPKRHLKEEKRGILRLICK